MGTQRGGFALRPYQPSARRVYPPAAFPDAIVDQVARRLAPVRVAERGRQKRYLAALGSAPRTLGPGRSLSAASRGDGRGEADGWWQARRGSGDRGDQSAKKYEGSICPSGL